METFPADMQQMLMQLQQLQETNPLAFQEAMKSLGIADEAPSSEFLEGGGNSDSLHKMAAAIEGMRKGSGEAANSADLNIGKGKEQPLKGVEITPSPGFTFKSTRIGDGMKVFVNMTQHELVDEPAIKKKLNDDGEEVEGMNIPMSVGPPRASSDKKGTPCTIYDIIVHPIVISESTADKSGRYREFICQLGIQYLEQKYKEALNKQYKLPKLKYMGDLIPPQHIQDRKNMPKIEEMSSSTAAQPSAAKKKKAAAASDKAKKLVVQETEKDLRVQTFWLKTSARAEGIADDTSAMDLNSCEHIEHAVSCLEYSDPIHEPSSDVAALLLYSDVQSYDLLIPELVVTISPFKLMIKAPGYKKTICYLPSAVLPASSYYSLGRPYEGCLSMVRINLILRIDRRDFNEAPDAGSRPWLVSQALSGGGDYNAAVAVDSSAVNPYSGEFNAYRDDSRNKAKALTESGGDQHDGTFAEDKFHLQLPDDVDPYTGVKLDVGDDPFLGKAASAGSKEEEGGEEEEYAEDKFHRKDASSQFMINQREQARKDKWEKHEQEKKERETDPNVEYIDMEDFRPGGKYGPKEEKDKQLLREQSAAQSDEMKKAAELLAASQKLPIEGGLSSTLWTELLD